jgi:tetratricopeptide (TPR) repeat protein
MMSLRWQGNVTWEPWPIDNYPLLARYVVPGERLKLDIDPPAMRAQKTYLEIARAIYDALCKRNLQYEVQPYDSDARQQQVRPPDAILNGAKVGTCLDLACLFAGECLGRGLFAVVVGTHGHAFVAIASDSDLNTGSGVPGRKIFKEGVIDDSTGFSELIETHRFVPIECTGFVHSTTSPEGRHDGISRNAQGFLTFEDAVRVGRKNANEQMFTFAIDVEYLQEIEAYKPFPLDLGIQENVRTYLESFHTSPKDSKVNAPPAARNTLFGRDADLQRTEHALRQGKTVLVHGMGGVGKTALTLEVASRLHKTNAFKDGIVWISEIEKAPTTAICDAIARALGNEDIPKLSFDIVGQRKEKLEATWQLLNTRSLTLILDDVALPETANEFIEMCLPQDTGVLMTSRRADIDAQEYIPLTVLRRDEAKRLFAERSKQKNIDEGVLDDICAVLEDHPLSLVIAAGRVRAEGMPVKRLLDRLQDGKIRLPTLAPDDTPDKDRNVRLSIEVSLDDVTDKQKHVLINLAACPAKTTGVEFLSMMCNLSQDDCEDHLGGLARRSLVITDDEHGRYGLHMLVRDFLRQGSDFKSEGLKSSFIDSGIKFSHKYNNITPKDLNFLESELTNLLNCIDSAVIDNSISNAIQIYNSIRGFLNVRGYWVEQLSINDRVIRLSVALRDDDVQIDHLLDKANVFLNYDDFFTTKEVVNQVLLLLKESNSPHRLAKYNNSLGRIYLKAENYLEARECFRKSAIAAKKALDKKMISWSIGNLAILESSLSNVKKAKALFNKAIEMFIKFEDIDSLALSYHQLGILYENLKEYSIALNYYEKSLEIAKELGDKLNIANTLHQIGLIAELFEENPEKAKSLYEQSSIIHRELNADNARISMESLRRVTKALELRN